MDKCKIAIDGMRCQNCVKKIEGAIGSRAGVVNIKVVLEDKTGYVEYKTRETSPNELAKAIADLGFKTSTDSPTGTDCLQLTSVVSNCSIHIDGMTCNSCVRSITGDLIGKKLLLTCLNCYIIDSTGRHIIFVT